MYKFLHFHVGISLHSDGIIYIELIELMFVGYFL